MKRTFKNFVLILVAIVTYFVAYSVTNTGSAVTANILPKESISVKVFGESQNGSLTLVKVSSDEHFTVVKESYPVFKNRWIKCKKPHFSPEIVDMPVFLEPIPFNGIIPLEVPNPMVPDIADLSPLSNELAI